MAISKSTPYVRYKKDFTSSLHLGTIHIESEYLDRTQKTTIESIHGMTWHNKVVNENKELNLLSDTQLELTELEKQYWNTGEKRVSVDEIHTLEEVEPNEDGTYTYTVNSMEGEYIEIYDGINNITSTSDGLDGQFEIVYDTTEEDINGNIALDSIVPQYEITDSGVGTITSAKSTGLTLVNHITESSKEEVVAIEQQEGRYFTIENTVQGNIKSAILKGNTLVNKLTPMKEIVLDNIVTYSTGKMSATKAWSRGWGTTTVFAELQPNTEYTIVVTSSNNLSRLTVTYNGDSTKVMGINVLNSNTLNFSTVDEITRGLTLKITGSEYPCSCEFVLLEGDYTNIDIPYFEGMQSVKMPVLTTFSYTNLINENDKTFLTPYLYPNKLFYKSTNNTNHTLHYYNADKVKIGNSGNEWSSKSQYQPPYGTVFVRMGYTSDTLSPMLGYNNEETYKPFTPIKSNILTVNEEVELRGIGDVRDTLNCLTGELVQSVGVLNGEEVGWQQELYSQAPTDSSLIAFSIDLIKSPNKNLLSSVLVKSGDVNKPYRWCVSFDTWLIITLPKSEVTNLDEFKAWLKNNEVLYPLAEKSIKTVDLTVQNQDGAIIPRIQTQQGITYVSTSSDGLSPVVEMSCSYDTIIKPNTTYTIKLDRPIVSDTMYLQVDLGGTMMMLDADVNAFTIKTPSTLSHSQLRLSGVGNTVKEIIVLEGNRVNDKIEYFEGMKNVENPILVVSNCPYVFGKGGRI